MWTRLRALPPYIGGKRRLLGRIFKHMPKPEQAPVLVDAFLGGGSVSLFGKARGYRVLCNDIALRGYIVGKALIENDRVTLTAEDVTRLFADGREEAPGFIEQHFARGVLTAKHARFLDSAFSVARQVEGTKRWLLLLLLTRYVIGVRPMGCDFGARTIMEQLEDGEWEQVNPNYLRQMIRKNATGHPKALADSLAAVINAGVFSNGLKNEVHRLDVFDLLKQVEGDVLYLDPPYAGALAYESQLRVLDCILEGRMVKGEASVFSKARAEEALERLLDGSGRFPLWVLSYGNATMGLDDLVAVVSKFRRVVHAEEILHNHLPSLMGEERRAANRELLIVAR
jgi:hypothetical protein